MKDKRDEVIEAAKKILGERMPTRDLPNATFSFEYLSGAMADFALSREAELRVEIATQIEQLCQQDKLINTVAKRSVMKIARKLRGKQ